MGTDTLIVEVLSKERAGEGLFKLIQDFSITDPVRGTLTVPAGYITDFASIPRPCRWLIPNAGKSAKAAVLHDYLLSRSSNPRWATGVFNRTLKSEGVGTIRRMMMVGFVAVFTFPSLYL